MDITITINCDNAAFESNDSGTEVARILRKLASRMEHVNYHLEYRKYKEFSEPLYDVNGNAVGRMAVTA